MAAVQVLHPAPGLLAQRSGTFDSDGCAADVGRSCDLEGADGRIEKRLCYPGRCTRYEAGDWESGCSSDLWRDPRADVADGSIVVRNAPDLEAGRNTVYVASAANGMACQTTQEVNKE